VDTIFHPILETLNVEYANRKVQWSFPCMIFMHGLIKLCVWWLPFSSLLFLYVPF
jgi:hypothetical protein